MVRNLWTSEELEILIKCYKQIDKEELLKLLPNRKWQNIKQKAYKLKLGIRRKPWSDEDNQTLTEIWLYNEAQVIGKVLSRSKDAVYAQAKLLGLDKKISYEYWSKEEIKDLKQLYPISTPYKLELHFKRPYSSIEHKALRLDIYRKKKPTKPKTIRKSQKQQSWEQWEIDILETYYENCGTKKLSETHLNHRSINSIQSKANKLGLSFDNNIWLQSDYDYLIENHQTMTTKELGANLGRTFQSTKTRIQKLLDDSVLEKKVNEWTDKEDKLLYKYFSHMTNVELMEKHLPNRTRWAIQTRATNLGLQNTPLQKSLGHTKHSFKYDLFSNGIDTYNKACLLGYIYADGNIFGNALQFECKIDDIEYLQKITNLFEWNGEIKTRERTATEGLVIGTRESAYFRLRNYQLIKDLNNLGVCENKSLTLTYPKFLDNKFTRDFIRGYIEGDGSFGYYGNTYVMEVLGTKEFVTIAQQEFIKDVYDKTGYSMNKTKLNKDKRAKNLYHFRYGGNQQVKILVKYLYKNVLDKTSKLFMKRKYQIIESLLI